MSTHQIGIPVDAPRPEEIEREKTLGSAIELCAKLAGFSLDKELQQQLEVDKAQFSRWHSWTEGIVWPKFVKLMDVCGNDAPLLWMLNQRGYDLHSLRKQESETESARTVYCVKKTQHFAGFWLGQSHEVQRTKSLRTADSQASPARRSRRS